VNPVYRSCVRLDRALDVFSATGTLPAGENYLRYWHGYTVLTRPALGLFGVAGTRWIAFTLVAVAVSAMAVAVARSFGLGVTAVLLAPTLLTTDTIISGLTAALAVAMASAWAGGWMSFTLVSRRPDARTAALAAAAAGALTAYFDLMTVMPGALALTVVGASLGMIAADREEGLRSGWRVAAAAAAGWVAGLAWMWGSKWLIAAITVGVDEVVDNVRARIDLWVGGQFRRQVDQSVGAGLVENLRVWWDRPLTPWVVLVIGVVLVVVATRRRENLGPVGGTALCAAIAVVPALGWYVVLNTHSQVHAAFLDRSIGMAFGGAAALLYVGLTAPREAHRAERSPVADNGEQCLTLR
jgi:hypothetical protein